MKTWLSNLYALIGRLGYRFLGRFARIYLGGSQRAYLIIDDGQKILMIKNWFGRQLWHLPGGGVRAGESPTMAVAREVAEEIGLKVDPALLKKITAGHWQSQGLNCDYQVFYHRLKSQPELKLKRPEILLANWISPNELDPATVPPEIWAAIAQLGQAA